MISQHMAKSVSENPSDINGAECSISFLLPCAACNESALTVSSFNDELWNLEDRTSIRESCSICDCVNILPPAITDANKIATAASCSSVIGRSCMLQM